MTTPPLAPWPFRSTREIPSFTPPPEVKPGEFDSYIGRYQVSETFGLNVTRDGNHLYIQGTGQPRAELFSEGDGQFFLRVVDAEVTFQTDSSGRARSLSLTQDGKTVPAQLVQ